MDRYSLSLTLEKASNPHGANLAYVHRFYGKIGKQLKNRYPICNQFYEFDIAALSDFTVIRSA